MADDSRDTSVSARQGARQDDNLPYQPSKSQTTRLWEEFGHPKEPVNLIPGTVQNSTSESKKSNGVSLKDVTPQFSFQNFKNVYKAPCARDSLMIGIAGGFGVGGIKAIFGGFRAIWPACNWAVGTFAVASIASFELCQRQRKLELNGIQEAKELMKELKAKRQREREADRIRQEELAHAEQEERRKKSWKFW